MKYIIKKKENEPESLIRYRSTPNANYDNCNKNDIRLALLKEQGYICAYCMQRINNEKVIINGKSEPVTNIEHYKSQSDNKSLKLNYTNMLGVCRGNKGFPKKLQHCDKSRGKKTLTINPLKKNCKTLVKYSSDGEVYSDHQQIDKELKTILNLNQDWLTKERRNAVDLVVQNLQNKYKNRKGKSWNKSDLAQEINYWESRNFNLKFRPFCQVAIYYLKKKLSRI